MLAKNRRQECSRVRSNVKQAERPNQPNDLNLHSNLYGLTTQLTSSSSDSSETGTNKNEESITTMPASKQLKKPKAKVLKVDVKHRVQYKYKLPIEKIPIIR